MHFWKKIFRTKVSANITEDDARDIRDAAKFGDLERVKSLLKSKPRLVFTSYDYCKTPLHYAVEGGHEEMVKVLLAKGAPVNAEDAVGQTPTLYAKGAGYSEIEELLRKRGGHT